MTLPVQAYATAYYNQQCQLNPLYDKGCTGYASANLAQQCDYDPLYSVECPNYQKAYLEKQCELDSLYDVQCPDYQTAIELAKIVDDGKTDDPTIIDNEIDVTTTTEIEGVPNVLTLPEQQTEVVEVESGDGFEQVDDSIEGEQMAMEDDIEKEIAQLENEASEESTAPDVISGGANQEDDIEKELAELKDSTKSENKQDAPKPKTRNEKIKILLAMKAIELTKKLEKEVSIEQNMVIQRQLLALISYVPGFDYNEKENKDGNFYPPKPTVDHAFARWFLNDPNFDVMENLQYPESKIGERDEVEYGGVKLTGSKLFMIIPLVSMLGGGLWAGFEFYKDYMDMKEQIQSYVAPDLSEFDKKLAVLREEMIALDEGVATSVDVMRETKHDLREDLVRMERILDKVENDIDVVEDEATALMDRTKKETRELILDANNRFNDKIDGMEGYVKRELQQLEDEMNTKLTKALDNPLANR